RGVEKVSRGFRVSFVCGLRAAAAARRDFDVLSRASAALSAGADEIPAAIERLRNDAKSGEKERQRLREELAGYHASRLAVEEQPSGGLRFVRRVFADRDPDYVRLLASKLAASVPRTVGLLASAESWPARVVLARSRDLDFHCGDLLKEALAARGLPGGGSPDLAQTDLTEDQLEPLAAELEKAVRSRCAAAGASR